MFPWPGKDPFFENTLVNITLQDSLFYDFIIVHEKTIQARL